MFGSVNVAMIGTGNIAATMAATLRKTKHAKLYAVASRDMTRAVEFGKKWGFRKAYGSYEDLVNDSKVKLVYIATPHSEHYANAKLCVEHGKACLVEKSFTANAQQAEDLLRLAEENHVFIAEAMWIRYMPFYKTITDMLNSGVIGAPTTLTANLGYNVRGITRMTDPKLAGGTLLDLGVYPLNFASMIFGDDIMKINATCTYTNRHLDEQDSISIVYKDGRMANLTASMLGPTDRQGIIYGTKGYMIVENINNFESLTVYNNEHKKVAYYRRPKQKTGYEYEVMAALRAIRNGWTEAPEMTHAQTLSIMHMMDFIREELGIVFPFEKNNKITGSHEAQIAAEASENLEKAAEESVIVNEAEQQQAQTVGDMQTATADDKGQSQHDMASALEEMAREIDGKD